MEKEYYIVNLNHNNSSELYKLDNIIYRGEFYHYPFEVVDDTLEEVYDSIEVLAEKTLFGLRDVITKETLFESEDGKTPDLSYNRKVRASEKDIVRISKLYKEMSNNDFERYERAINRIKNTSKFLYDREIQMKEEELNEVKSARDFLLHYFV